MLKILTKNRRGFTLVELMVVVVLLSFGVLALANMFRVTYRAFEKSEERSIKQETVKSVAEMLREGQTNVASASSADIFGTTDVIPPTDADTTYSYLYFEPHRECSSCGAEWNTDSDSCSASCGGENADGKVDGYFIKCMNKGQKKSQAIQLSDIPIYVSFEPMKDFPTDATDEEREDKNNMVNQCGIRITLAALENDFEYEKKNETSGEIELQTPISDNIYYSLNVAYHFPNMVLAENGVTVNQNKANEKSKANLYNSSGIVRGTVPAVDEGGVVLRIYSDTIISGDSANANITTPTLCFIATASYGHDSGEVGLLCKFRDECLLTNPLGTAFVKTYYKLSPPIADFISEREPLKAAVRLALKPVVMVAANALDEQTAHQSLACLGVFVLCGAGVSATLVKISKRKVRRATTEKKFE